MATVEEYVRTAEEAQLDGSHVAVLMYYRTAIEATGYNRNAVDILLAAVRYAQILKKDRDKLAVAAWSRETLGRLQIASLSERIETEIAKLEIGGGKSAAT